MWQSESGENAEDGSLVHGMSRGEAGSTVVSGNGNPQKASLTEIRNSDK